MNRRIPTVLLVALLTLAPSSIAMGAAPPIVPAGPHGATAYLSPTAPVNTMAAQVEALRHSLEGSRVPGVPAGSYAGKNVIIIQVESLNDFLIGKKYGGKEITPNLNRLIDSSSYWPNMYSETGMGNTVDAEFIVNTSLYAPQDQASSVKYANRVVPALPRVLGSLGYYSFTMHQNKVSFWNRGQLYRALGFTRYYDRSFFKGVPRMGQYGASDEALFKYGVRVLRGLETSGAAPVYSQFITLSAHGPFDAIPESKRPVRTPRELAGSLMGKYISAESYSDLAIGQFVKDLKAAGIWDKSIVIIYGDHTAMPGNTLTGQNALGAKRLLGRSYGPIDRQRISLIVHLPGQTAPVLRNDVAGQVDIMPTVADLVGADISSVPHMGRSLFANPDGALVSLNAYFPRGTFLNNRVLFVPVKGSSKGVAYWVAKGSGTGATGIDRADAARVGKLIKLSDSWLMSLPKFNAGPKGWIPDPAARRAAKAYGFLQH